MTVQEVSGDWGAVEGPGPGARETHGVVRVHVGQEEEPGGASPAQAPKVHSDGRLRDQDPVHGGGVGESPVGSSWEQSSCGRLLQRRPEKSHAGARTGPETVRKASSVGE